MNWNEVLAKLIVPIGFVLFWGITALFNRESKGFPARPTGPLQPPGPRPGDPNLRWAPPRPAQGSNPRQTPLRDDDILIIPSDPMRPARPALSRPPQQQAPNRRPLRSRATPAVLNKKPEPAPSRPKMGNVVQNVNQSLARPIEMTPLTTIAPMATSTGSDLASAPSAPSKTSAVLTVSRLIPLMNDPVRLREAFVVNELLQPPISLRGRRGHHG